MGKVISQSMVRIIWGRQARSRVMSKVSLTLIVCIRGGKIDKHFPLIPNVTI